MPNLGSWHILVIAMVLLFVGGVIGSRIAILGSVIKASREASHGITTLLEEAAEQMAQDSPQHWAAWSLHLLKALDIRVTGDGYPAALQAIRRSIDTRLDTGQWEDQSPEQSGRDVKDRSVGPMTES